MRNFLAILLLTLLPAMFLCQISQARGPVAAPRTEMDFDTWLLRERQVAEAKILQNISPGKARRGAIIASPSKSDPNYYYHWVRDAALVMDVWMRQLEGYSHSKSVSALESLMWDFFDFTAFSQGTNTLVGMGEPRYNVDGTANLDPWGRPQNDGPALRASLFIRFARYLMAHEKGELARNAVWPVIEKDLNYVGDQVRAASFDLWEEMRGDHFYTRVTMRMALLMGSEMARDFGDYSKAAWLSGQAAVAQSLAMAHFNQDRGQITENTHREEGVDYKWSGLDVATVLALLHTRPKPIVDLKDWIVVSTLEKIDRRFHSIYNINKIRDDLGTAIGRYPEDLYAGHHFNGGNPWFLATLAFAEYYYLTGDLDTGDKYMRRVKYHVDGEGRMDEQFNRENGYMQSAYDLTWSYAAYLTALEARDKLTSTDKK